MVHSSCALHAGGHSSEQPSSRDGRLAGCVTFAPGWVGSVARSWLIPSLLCGCALNRSAGSQAMNVVDSPHQRGLLGAVDDLALAASDWADQPLCSALGCPHRCAAHLSGCSSQLAHSHPTRALARVLAVSCRFAQPHLRHLVSSSAGSLSAVASLLVRSCARRSLRQDA